jgi:large subunit ribosomal protein L4
MTKVNTYSLAGKKLEGTTLPKEMLGDTNLVLLAQAVRVFENRQHQGLSKVKTRGVMTMSTRKIYAQKGTGGARHGAKSAPIFVGGGIAHGPTGNKRTLEMPQKMRAKALSVALNLSANEGTLVVVEGLAKLAKTKEAQKLMDAIRKETGALKSTKFTFVLADKNLGNVRYLRNLKVAEYLPYRNVNAHTIVKGGTVVLDSEALKENPKSQLPISKKGKEKVESTKTVESKPKSVKVSAKKETGKKATKSAAKVTKKK